MMHQTLASSLVVAAICLSRAVLVSAVEPVIADAKPNLLLITLDTVRADHLSCNGAKNVSTPHLDRLAKGGVNFTRTRTSVPLTLPAHASIMTGNYPPVHGVRDNGSFRLPEDQLTLAEVLTSHGYETAAFIGAFVLDHDFGLAQGFEVYNEGEWGNAHRMENLSAERSAGAVHEAFSRWLRNRVAERPFFAWVHLYDPHAPYVPPEPFRTRYADDPYAGEIAYSDAAVGEIIEDLRSRKLLASTLVAVIGDHGEGLGEHGEHTHSLLVYNSTIHVPMLLYFPRLIPSGKTAAHLTRTIDLAPTILDYLGIPQNFGQGLSLRPLVDGKSLGEEITAYSESLYPSLNLGWSELRALEVGDYRFILAPHPELYDLTEDPAELENRIDASSETGDRLQGVLESLMESMSASEGHAKQAVDSHTREMLHSLGYLSSGDTPPPPDASLVDPKDHMELWARIETGLALFNQGNDTAAIDTFNGALAEDGNIPILYDHIGWSYVRLNQYDRAEHMYRRAIDRGFDSAETRANLGLIYYRWGNFEKAERELQNALRMDERSITANYRLADVYRATKNYSRAIEQYRRVLEIDPGYVWALNGLGMALATEGKNDEALAAFQEVVRIEPEMAPGYLNLAIHLERMKRFPEALEAYQKFMELSSDDGLARERAVAAAAIKRLQSR